MINEGDTPGGYNSVGGGAGAIGALIGAGAGLYDSYQNRKVAKQNTDKTIAASKAEAELAYQRSVQMWHMQNMYNTPQAQMQRFAAGGLNPHLIYGQGSSGQASSPPQYQPAAMQHRYEAAQVAPSIQSILPTLMSVGTWMQNMRATEAGIRKTEVDTGRSVTETERARQLIDYLMQRNPQVLKDAENKLSLYPYQRNLLRIGADTAQTKLYELEQEFRHRFGEDLFQNMGSAFSTDKPEIGGIRRLQFLQEQSKTKLLDAKSSWSDFSITDPQSLMQLVLSGVMGLAGQTLRLSSHRPSKPMATPKRERPRGLVRRRMSSNHPDRN